MEIKGRDKENCRGKKILIIVGFILGENWPLESQYYFACLISIVVLDGNLIGTKVHKGKTKKLVLCGEVDRS